MIQTTEARFGGANLSLRKIAPEPPPPAIGPLYLLYLRSRANVETYGLRDGLWFGALNFQLYVMGFIKLLFTV